MFDFALRFENVDFINTDFQNYNQMYLYIAQSLIQGQSSSDS